ncbi:energy transducer TonB [Sphingomonas sp. ASV193]|uniref:energy transducer TonB n=1 Tax=Sphingomonas sp. ASV193 TaxID=3144405 RepID=UPI0032E8F61B
MYRSETRPADRIATIAGIGLIHVGIILALLNLTGTIDLTTPQPNLKIFDVKEVPPPPPLTEPPPKPAAAQKPRPKDEAGRAAPENLKSQAAEIKRPDPVVKLPVKPPVQTAPTPAAGVQPTQGAGQRPGPGTGAGGAGNGTGAGGNGNGNGGGGGGIASPSQILRKVSGRQYPPQVQARWPRDGRIFTRLRIEADGRISQCDVMRSFGDPVADQWTCALLRQNALFRPALDRSGRPVASWFGYVQAPY